MYVPGARSMRVPGAISRCTKSCGVVTPVIWVTSATEFESACAWYARVAQRMAVPSDHQRVVDDFVADLGIAAVVTDIPSCRTEADYRCLQRVTCVFAAHDAFSQHYW